MQHSFTPTLNPVFSRSRVYSKMVNWVTVVDTLLRISHFLMFNVFCFTYFLLYFRYKQCSALWCRWRHCRSMTYIAGPATICSDSPVLTSLIYLISHAARVSMHLCRIVCCVVVWRTVLYIRCSYQRCSEQIESTTSERTGAVAVAASVDDWCPRVSAVKQR